jgi:hypothetical protein
MSTPNRIKARGQFDAQKLVAYWEPNAKNGIANTKNREMPTTALNSMNIDLNFKRETPIIAEMIKERGSKGQRGTEE